MKWKRLTGLVAAGIIAAAMLALALRTFGSEEEREAARPAQQAATGSGDRLRYPAGAAQLAMIRAEAVQASPVPLAEPLAARIAYDEDVTSRIGVGFAGRLVAIHAMPGDRVKRGQALADIDSADFGSAAADLSKARADETRKRLVMERGRELVPGEAIAARDWEAAVADYESARAETARAQQRVANLNPQGLPVRGQRVSLTSPLSGVVTERTATPALEVSPGMAEPLFVVTDPARRWLFIDVPERVLGRIRVGSKVSVETDAWPGEQFAATVTQLAQAIDPHTRRAVVRASVDNAAGKLLPEMYARALVLAETGSGVRVPNGAIVVRGIKTYVFVQTAPGEFERREVRLLTHGGESSYVSQGLAGGEHIVVKGALLLDADTSLRAGHAS